MPEQMTENRTGRAIALKLGAVFLFMVMAALIKTASDDVPPGQAVFFRSLFAIPIIWLWLWRTGHLHDGVGTGISERPYGTCPCHDELLADDPDFRVV